MPLPEAIENKPVLLDGLYFYMEAFQTLSSCRNIGQGVIGPIPWSALSQYADRHNIKDEESFLLLEIYLQKMDAMYVKHVTDELKRTASGG